MEQLSLILKKLELKMKLFLQQKNLKLKVFLLDFEHPFIIKSPGNFKKYLTARFSEFEPIELSYQFKKFVSWIWIDTVYKLPINKDNIQPIRKFKSCLVSPERWGRKNDIKKYIDFFKQNRFKPISVMTDLHCSKIQEEF